LVRDIKSGSSGFINKNKWVKEKFNWQEGFGAFSYSKKDIINVINYILNQEDHHKHKNFKDEYLELLNDFQIEFNEKYLFEWIE
jgi:putative transposase